MLSFLHSARLPAIAHADVGDVLSRRCRVISSDRLGHRLAGCVAGPLWRSGGDSELERDMIAQQCCRKSLLGRVRNSAPERPFNWRIRSEVARLPHQAEPLESFGRARGQKNILARHKSLPAL
jgi:hypothetical protein